ncbi:MAG: ATP-dependent Clp protease adaptor ClpS [Saprospiraceae bacterium]|nr:ATP-dependent Clp protease adaptor ClpS [Saprospiraceae bacterium]
MSKDLDSVLTDELNELLVVEQDSKTGYQTAQLLVYNDDFNTFDWVIQCFMEVCNHTFEQSEQLSLIVHYKGKAVVKTADMAVLKPMKEALVERGLSAVIEVMVEDK